MFKPTLFRFYIPQSDNLPNRVYLQSPKNEMTSGLTNEKTLEAIEELDSDHRILLIMFLKGFSYSEIAENQNLQQGIVKSRIFLSRQKLSRMLIDDHTNSF